MRLLALAAAGLSAVPLAGAASGVRVVTGGGVRLALPAAWSRVRAAPSGAVTDPRTLLVVGTAGVRPRSSSCQIAAYRIPAAGAAVVVVGWKSLASSGGGPLPRGRRSLRRLVAVHRPSFECFSGRGAAADVMLGGKPYQVNVLVGDRASRQRVAAALAVARSFDLAR